MRKLFVFFLLGIFLISFTSAAIIKNVDDSKGEKFGAYTYGELTIKEKKWYDIFGWFDEPILTANIQKHTAECLWNCYSEGSIVVSRETKLFDKVDFKDDKGKTQIKNYKVWIWKDGNKTINYLVGYDGTNKSIINSSVIDDGKWIEYDGKKLSPGVYRWKITLTKSPEETLDWIPTMEGVTVNEWAWWAGLSGYYANFSKTGYHTWTVPAGVTNVSVLVVGGGGGGGSGAGNDGAGGGGAGGVIYNSSFKTTPTGTIYIWVGAGGNGATGDDNGLNGTKSNITMGSYTHTAKGGGGGGGYYDVSGRVSSGGSGGGGYGDSSASSGGLGTSGQGNDGGNGGAGAAGSRAGGAGGGAGAVGENAETDGSGYGGDGGTGVTYFGEMFGCGGGGGGTVLGTAGCSGAGIGGSSGASATAANNSYGHGGGGSGTTATAGGNGGSGLVFIRYTAVADFPPVVTYLWPEDTYNFSTSTITTNVTAYDDNAITKVALYLNGTLNQTNSSGLNNTKYTFNVALSDGAYQFYINVTDDGGLSTTTSTKNILVDTTFPVLNITAPIGNDTYGKVGTNETLNWTLTEINPYACWFTYGGTNTTADCTKTGKYFVLGTQRNLTMWVNDSAGNTVSDFTNWDYKILEVNQSFDTSVTEGSYTNFTAWLIIGGGYTISSATFNYSGDSQSAGVATSGIYTILSITDFPVPNVIVDGNKTFNWTIVLTDSSAGLLETKQQTILNLGVDDCSSNSEILYNFTMYDERTRTFINNVTIPVNSSIQFILYNRDKTIQLGNYSKYYINKNPFFLCLENALVASSDYKIDLQVQYWAVNYSKEFYNIVGEDLTIDDQYSNISLYPLDNSTAQIFKIIYKDASFLPVPNAVIQIQRKYIGLGEFYVVEQPKTDSDGETIAHLEKDNVIYNFVVLVNGEVESIFNNKIAQCANPLLNDCEITLNAVFTDANVKDFANINGLAFLFQYNKNTRTVSVPYTVKSGAGGLINLSVTHLDNYGNNTICSSEVFSSGGTLSCVVPSTFGNSTVLAYLYFNGDLVGESVISLAEDPAGLYGVARVFLGLVAFLSLIVVGIIGEPMIAGIFLIIAAVGMVALNLVASTGIIGASATILWFIVAVVLVLIKGGNR